MISGNEEYWMRVVAEDRKVLDQMIEMTTLNPDLFDKRDLDLTKRFIQFMEMIFKYDNLTVGGHKNVCTRLVRIHRNIPSKELSYYGYEFVVFNGLYIVSEVMFLDADLCRKYFSNASRPDVTSSIDIPDSVRKGTIKYIVAGDGTEVGVALLKDSPISRYIDDSCVTKWSYPIF